jgi:hypothetical protein
LTKSFTPAKKMSLNIEDLEQQHREQTKKEKMAMSTSGGNF